MRNGEITTVLSKLTAERSHFETERDYISLSQIALAPEEIIKQYQSGFDDTLEGRLKCYKGYQMEADLLNRIKLSFCFRIQTGIEISAFNGLVKGHPDFAFDGFPGDCKSVLMDSWIPEDSKLSRKIYWQMQAYMKYLGKDKAVVIYESRETGKLADFWINANAAIQNEIEEKLRLIVKAVSQKVA